MEFSKCFLCLKEYSPRESVKKTEEILGGFTDDNGDPMKTKLDIIFLLKKILQIPENVFSEFSQKFGDPNLWIDCCESCSIIVEKGIQIWNEIMLLEEQFTKVQCRIKDKLKYSSDDAFQNYFNSEANTAVRSYVRQAALDDATKVPLDDVKVEGIQNSPIRTYASETIMLPPPDNELSYIDRGYREEELPHHTGDINNLSAETENPSLNTEIDYGDTNIYVRTSGFKEGKPWYSAEGEEKQNVDPLGIISSEPETKCFTESSDTLTTFKCAKCCETYTPESKLLGDKQFPCGMCDKRFNYPADLQLHVQNHPVKKSVKCELCENQFPGNTSLRRHAKEVHSGERPFNCELCEKRFPISGLLKLHVKEVHNGERAFKCTLCEKRYTTLASVRIHVKTFHNGERPYKCDLCQKEFIEKRKLMSHVNVFHDAEKPFKCNLCQKRFLRKRNLTGHLKTVHK